MKLLLSFLLLHAADSINAAASTINADHRFAWGANIGWLDFRTDGANGVSIGEFVCAGYVYSANTGWIHLGDGAPADGVRYQNNSSADYGVNHDGAGNLTGYAYGANIGWVNFGLNFPAGAAPPRFDIATGKLNGSVYGANVGWISLSNAVACVQTDSITPGPDIDADGITDSWEFQHTTPPNLTTFTATSDRDGDGVSDLQEYRADTDPLNAADHLEITALQVDAANAMVTLTWRSRPTRLYHIQTRPAFNGDGDWTTLNSGNPDPAETTTRTVQGASGPARFFRIQALKPLSP
jgi:hypothetical protein